MPEFHSRSAVVTGGARGIGAAIAHTLVKSGLGVVVADLLDAEGAATAESLGATAIFRHLDVTDEYGWRQVGFIVNEATFSTGSEFVIDRGATTGMTLVEPAEAHGTWQ